MTVPGKIAVSYFVTMIRKLLSLVCHGGVGSNRIANYEEDPNGD